jgi:lipopolysaccharide export system protein LptA
MSALRTKSVPILLAAMLAIGTSSAHAQPGPKGPPNALQGFSQNRDQPVHIESATLEVRDKDKVATFSGDVRVKQGDTNMRCKSLMVFYEQDGDAGNDDAGNGGKPMQAAAPGPDGQQKIKRLEAFGGVVVTQKQQTATGEKGIFDMKANTVTLIGNVVMTQGKNVLRGERLVVDLTTGISRVESGKNGSGRVQGLFLPSNGDSADHGKGGPPAGSLVRPFN